MIEKPDTCKITEPCTVCKLYPQARCPLNAEFKKWRQGNMDKSASMGGIDSYQALSSGYGKNHKTTSKQSGERAKI